MHTNTVTSLTLVEKLYKIYSETKSNFLKKWSFYICWYKNWFLMPFEKLVNPDTICSLPPWGNLVWRQTKMLSSQCLHTVFTILTCLHSICIVFRTLYSHVFTSSLDCPVFTSSGQSREHVKTCEYSVPNTLKFEWRHVSTVKIVWRYCEDVWLRLSSQ